MFECKSEVKESRESITKTEVGQFNNHCGWFEGVYGGMTKVNRFIFIPTQKVSYEGHFTHEVKVIRKHKLNYLKRNILNFIKELAAYNFSEMHIDKINQLLVTHELKTDDFESLYSEEIIVTK